MRPQPLLDLIQINKSYYYGEHRSMVLKGINLQIEQGEFVAIMGPSGSGKSTLLNLIGCLDNYDEGKYFFDGQLVNSLTPQELAHLRNEKIGFVFQQFYLLQTTTVLENVSLPSLYQKNKTAGDKRRCENRAKALLQQVGLSGLEDHFPTRISGGQQQRVAVARAIFNDPPVILADEPTGNLDTQASLDIINIFLDLNSRGKTIVMITHEPDLAEYAQRTITLIDGQIVRERFLRARRGAA